MRLDARGIEWYSMNAQLLRNHLVLFKVILPFLDYGLAGKSCSYSSQSQLRRRATIGLVLILLSIWDRQILYMLRTCFRTTATVSSLRGEWLRVWLWSLNSQLYKSCSLARMGQVRVKYLNAEDGVPHAEKTCRNQGFLVYCRNRI